VQVLGSEFNVRLPHLFIAFCTVHRFVHQAPSGSRLRTSVYVRSAAMYETTPYTLTNASGSATLAAMASMTMANHVWASTRPQSRPASER
jgi:hypothetical protein